MTYQQAAEKLGNRERRRLPGRATYLVRRCPFSIAVQLHDTDVVTLYADGRAKLDSGGHRTRTTKARMTEYSGWVVWNWAGTWYVKCAGELWLKDRPFVDGMMLPTD